MFNKFNLKLRGMLLLQQNPLVEKYLASSLAVVLKIYNETNCKVIVELF